MSDYNIEAEKKFIDNIGSGRYYNWAEKRNSLSRMELLKKYKKAITKRANWIGMNKDTVNAYLNNAIFKERSVCNQ